MRQSGYILLKVVIGCLLVTLLAPCAHGIIYPKSSAPNGYKFYPIPIDTIGVSMFLADVYKYYEAQQLRDSSILDQLRLDRLYTVNDMVNRQVPGFGFNPSTTESPFLRNLLVESFDIFAYAANYKPSVKRVRPCRRFREKTYGVESSLASEFMPGGKSEYAFPSSHASASWGIALLLTCVNPWHADTIISRGLAHSQSRVIGGVHWQSDVDAGKILSTANYARMFAYPAVLDMIDSAKLETQRVLSLPPAPLFDDLLADDDSLALLTLRLPRPYDMQSPVGSCDLAVLTDRMAKRTATIQQQARQQVDLSTANVLDCFTSQMGTTITAQSHPATYALVDMHLRMCRKVCSLMQGRYDKPRPVDYYGIVPATGEDIDSLRSNSPYPSLHAAMGWTASMTLMMLRPSYMNTILKQGVAYGENRIAAGTTWPSDVEMGRLVACIAFGYTTSCREYTDMVRAALAEFSTQ